MQREHTERTGEASVAASARAGAEQASDADPSDHNGQSVLAARSARDLAKPRAERAARRIAEAQRDVEAVEYAVYVACLERDIDAAAAPPLGWAVSPTPVPPVAS